jgi:hypothetical protein
MGLICLPPHGLAFSLPGHSRGLLCSQWASLMLPFPLPPLGQALVRELSCVSLSASPIPPHSFPFGFPQQFPRLFFHRSVSINPALFKR